MPPAAPDAPSTFSRPWRSVQMQRWLPAFSTDRKFPSRTRRKVLPTSNWSLPRAAKLVTGPLGRFVGDRRLYGSCTGWRVAHVSSMQTPFAASDSIRCVLCDCVTICVNIYLHMYLFVCVCACASACERAGAHVRAHFPLMSSSAHKNRSMLWNLQEVKSYLSKTEIPVRC